MPLSRPHRREAALRCESGDDGSTEKVGQKPEHKKEMKTQINTDFFPSILLRSFYD